VGALTIAIGEWYSDVAEWISSVHEDKMAAQFAAEHIAPVVRVTRVAAQRLRLTILIVSPLNL
jgi:hypothetical protein